MKMKEEMDIHKKFRLIGFYNKPNQNMYEELVFVEEATELAKLLGSSINSIVSNNKNRFSFSQYNKKQYGLHL